MSLYVDIEKTLGSFHLKVKLEAADETLALLGASGCGKSLTLKCIAGIETPDKGKIVVDDVVLFDSEKKINLSPQQRRTGLMFQNYALFPNMTVLQNIRTGANRETDRKKREAAVTDLLESFGLTELKNRLPHQLSGGAATESCSGENPGLQSQNPAAGRAVLCTGQPSAIQAGAGSPAGDPGIRKNCGSCLPRPG